MALERLVVDTLVKLHDMTIRPKNLGSPSPTTKFYPKEPREYVVQRLRTELAEGEERVLSLETEEALELADIEQEYTNMTVQDDYKSDEHEYQRAVEGMINEGFHNTDRVRQIHAHPKIKHIFAPDTWTGLRKIEPAPSYSYIPVQYLPVLVLLPSPRIIHAPLLTLKNYFGVANF